MKVKCAHDGLVSIKKLIPHPKNRNKHPKEQIARLAKVIEYQGIRRPIRVSELSGYITAGHCLYEAAKLLKWKELPVDYQPYDDEDQEIADGIADNSIALWADLDFAGINMDVPNLGPDFDIDWLGIKDFVIEPAEKIFMVDEDSMPSDGETETRVKPGQIWQLGDHRLLCGDSTSKLEVESLMNGEKADMVFTDPPYNVASESKNFAKDKSKAMEDLSEAKWDKDFDINPSLDRLKESVSENCTLYIWTSQWLVEKIWSHLNNWCDYTSYCVWTKPNPMPSLSKRHWTWATELCVYGSIGSKRVVNFPSQGHALNWWNDVKKSDGTHPTQKPIEICERPILFSSDPGQLVLDLFLGSGSTLIACEKTNRKCYGLEIDPHYCDVIIARWEKFTGSKAILANG